MGEGISRCDRFNPLELNNKWKPWITTPLPLEVFSHRGGVVTGEEVQAESGYGWGGSGVWGEDLRNA